MGFRLREERCRLALEEHNFCQATGMTTERLRALETNMAPADALELAAMAGRGSTLSADRATIADAQRRRAGVYRAVPQGNGRVTRALKGGWRCGFVIVIDHCLFKPDKTKVALWILRYLN